MKTPDCYGIVFSICYKFQSNDFLETNRLPRNKCFSLLTLGLLDNLFGATFHSPWFISVLSISVFSPWKSSVWSSESFLLWGFPNIESWGACGDHQHGNNDAIKCDKHSFIGFGLLILRRNQFVIMFTSLYIADTFIFDTSWVSVLPVDWVPFFCRLTAHVFEYIAHLGRFHLRRLSTIWLYWTSDGAVCVNTQHLPDSGPRLTGFCPGVSELARLRILTDVLGSLVNHSWLDYILVLISILDLKSNKCPDANK